MDVLRNRAHSLIDQLSDQELSRIWTVMADLYYDSQMLRAIESAHRVLTPGETLTREEALRLLMSKS